MMQDQQKNISQLTEAVQNLTSKLHEQTKINEKLMKQQNEERENIKSVLNSMQKNTTSALNKLSKDVSKVYCIFFHYINRCGKISILFLIFNSTISA